MKLREIVKPNVGDAGDALLLPPDMDVCEVPAAALADGRRIVLVGEPGQPVLGGIDVGTLAYIAGRYDLIGATFILDNLEEGVIAIDPDSRIFFANQTYTRLLGVPIGKIIGKKMRDIEAGAAMNAVLETREALYRAKTYIQTIDRYVSVRIFPLYRGERFEGVVSLFRDVTELNSLNQEISRITEVAREYQNQIQARNSLAALDIVGDDPRFAKVIEQAMLVARTDATVLLLGENGTGKEILASLIRRHSQREDKPFITVNCAAIPESLAESELFGYEEGAFTGAKKGGRIGKLQLAEGGTLFLDEVGDLPYAMQGKLLRFLQNGEIERLGEERPRPLNVRVVAATNQPLEEMIARKAFRRDLYYRLNVFSLSVPPLRERGHDLLLLTRHFLALFNKRYKGRHGKELELTREVYRRMSAYSWPGNVRELKNYVERSVILSSWADVSPDGFGCGVPIPGTEAIPGFDDGGTRPLSEAMRDYERDSIEAALRRSGNNRTEAMRALAMSRRTFYRKLKDYGL